MKLDRIAVCLIVLVGAHAVSASASPTMIRLGYNDCASCHISPQGGGMLTTYGKGVDEAQSLRHQEVHPVDTAASRLLYDVRFVTASQIAESLATGHDVKTTTFRLQGRSSLLMSEHNRLSAAFGLETPVLTTAGMSASTAGNLVVYKALYEYRPKENFEIAMGRDEMPSGIGLPDPLAFIRSGNDAGDTAYPTQVKAFWYTHRLQLTPYAFGPGGDEPAALRQHGGGMVAGVDVWKHRAIVGVTSRLSEASTFHRNSVGAYARLGFGKWGVLAEHDLTSRTMRDETAPQPQSQYLAGHTQVFFAPVEWLVTSIAAEHLVVDAANQTHVYRLTPGVQTRISDNLTLIVNMREAFTGVPAGRARTFSIQLAVKSVQ
jgi:hypothetical protein